MATIQPYLFYRGLCEEAIEHYKAKLGAEVVMLLRFKDNPDRPPPEKVPASMDDRVMHAEIKVGGASILLSDGMMSGPCDFNCMSLTMTVATEAEADKIYNALAEDGKIQMPIGPSFFARRFGSVADKFGVSWMIIVPA